MGENAVIAAIEEQKWLEPLEQKTAQAVKEAFTAGGPAGQAAKNALHGVFLGHPLHPSITDVPVGSWTVAAALDLLEVRGDAQYQAGADFAVLLGLLASVPAALSGVTDWSETHGGPQRVGMVHGMLNLAAAGLYAGSYAARKAERRGLGRWLGFAGYGLVAASAYLGGELSYSQKIGVNHAPDEIALPKEFTPAMAATDLVEGKPVKATVQGIEVFVLKQEGTIYAMANQCSHLSGPLADGKFDGESVVCPWHGSRFCLKDGKVLDGPATNKQPTFDVRVENGEVLLRGRSVEAQV